MEHTLIHLQTDPYPHIRDDNDDVYLANDYIPIEHLNFIVKACNSHYELLEALKEFVIAFDVQNKRRLLKAKINAVVAIKKVTEK